MGHNISFDAFDDVPKMLCGLTGMKESTVKKWLNDKVVSTMTYEQLCEIDPKSEIEGWFQEIRNRLSNVNGSAEVAASSEN
ncbi:hypothetical protein D3C77_758740 [compost metagenome]